MIVDDNALSPALGDLSRLEILYLQNNKIKQLPSSFSNLRSLKTVDFTNLGLQVFPPLENWVDAVTLLMPSNDFTLPVHVAFDRMRKLVNLRTLDLSNNPRMTGRINEKGFTDAGINDTNPITGLPLGISLTSLETLMLNNVGLEGPITKGAWRLFYYLRRFDIQNNPKIESLPLDWSFLAEMNVRNCSALRLNLTGDPYIMKANFQRETSSLDVIDSINARCAGSLVAGITSRFRIIVDPAQYNYGGGFCSCLDGYFGDPSSTGTSSSSFFFFSFFILNTSFHLTCSNSSRDHDLI